MRLSALSLKINLLLSSSEFIDVCDAKLRLPLFFNFIFLKKVTGKLGARYKAGTAQLSPVRG